MRRVLSITFLALMLALVLAPGAALIARLGPSFGPIEFLTDGALYGQVLAAKQPEIDSGAFASGRAQALLGPWLAEHMGLPRERLIRMSNLFDFWAGRSSNRGILVGRNNELYTREQLNEWCRHGNSDYTEDLARRLVRAKDRLHTMGKAFVFLISPNKAALSPENIPSYCRPPATPRAVDRLVARLAALDFPVVNSEAILRAARAAGEWPSFGRYSQHWNDIGRLYAVRAVVTEFERQLKRPIGRLELAELRVDDQPTGDDVDTGMLLNLPVELRTTTPHATYAVKDRGQPIDIVFVGTSFANAPLDALLTQRLASRVTLYNYFRRSFEFTPDRRWLELPQPPPDLFAAALRHADAVILESNAPALGSGHVGAFLDAVEALP